MLISLPITFILGSEDLFKAYGILSGMMIAFMFEKKYVNFSLDTNKLKKTIRLLLGIIIMLGLQIGLKLLYSPFLEEGTYLFDVLSSIRYVILTFIGIGLYPMLFKKFNFLKLIIVIVLILLFLIITIILNIKVIFKN